MTLVTHNDAWPLWKKILFRFFFIYLLFQATPWMWLDKIPGVYFFTRYYDIFIDWAVRFANANIFHFRKNLIHNTTTSDASWNWVEQFLYLSLALCGCFIWSLIERTKNNYIKLNYWLCLVLRYYLVFLSFEYGLLKIFLRQMPFPSQSQLDTTLGDLLPMRLAWMFMGYSKVYEGFAGLMEILAGILLLFRRTATPGVLLALVVYANVMIINLGYDIPVKLFSINVVLCCLYLLANDSKRILSFSFNKPAAPCTVYNFSYAKKGKRNTRLILKTIFIIAAFIIPFFNYYEMKYGHQSSSVALKPEPNPIKPGIYDVIVFKLNKDSLPFSPSDSLRWQDVIFEGGANAGSIKTTDTLFRQRYRRGYFRFQTDESQHIINFGKLPTDSIPGEEIVLSMHYNFPDDNSIELSGKKMNGDSLYVLLKRSNRHFQLAEKQFHWVSDYNR